jgi:hypothetical protein
MVGVLSIWLNRQPARNQRAPAPTPLPRVLAPRLNAGVATLAKASIRGADFVNQAKCPKWSKGAVATAGAAHVLLVSAVGAIRTRYRALVMERLVGGPAKSVHHA